TPEADSPWPVEGKIANLRACTKVVNIEIDPWTELPVLALWQRKVLDRGGAIVALGAKNGLVRDTAAWLRGGSLVETLKELLQALDGRHGHGPIAAAAAKLKKDGPACVLVGVACVRESFRTLELTKQLAAKLGANGETGLVGAPARGANARGAQ